MKPIHPGAILKDDLLNELALSNHQAVEILSANFEHLIEVLNEKAAISSDMAEQLQAVFGINREFWMRIQTKYDLGHIKLLY